MNPIETGREYKGFNYTYDFKSIDSMQSEFKEQVNSAISDLESQNSQLSKMVENMEKEKEQLTKQNGTVKSSYTDAKGITYYEYWDNTNAINDLEGKIGEINNVINNNKAHILSLQTTLNETSTFIKNLCNQIKTTNNDYANKINDLKNQVDSFVKNLQKELDKIKIGVAQDYTNYVSAVTWYNTNMPEKYSNVELIDPIKIDKIKSTLNGFGMQIKNEGIQMALQRKLAIYILTGMGQFNISDGQIADFLKSPYGLVVISNIAGRAVLFENQLKVVDLYSSLQDVLDIQENWQSKMLREMNIPFDEIITLLLENDEYIESQAKSMGVDKSWVQAILFREMRCLNPLDWADGFKQDSSSGWAQIKPQTAIDALNWYNQQKGSTEIYTEDDKTEIWKQLNNDPKFSIKMSAILLKKYEEHAKELLGDTFDINDKNTVEFIFAQHNYSDAEPGGNVQQGYGHAVNQYVDAFKSLNK